MANGGGSVKISRIKTTVVNIPFVAPLRWAGGVEDGWSRCIVEMETDNGLVGLGETLGGLPTKMIIDGDLAPMFLGEDPFATEKMLAKTLFVPFYYGKAGLCAAAALEMACWDLKGKAIGRPLSDLLGGRMRDEVQFASYIFYRHPDKNGEGGVANTDQVVAYTRDLHGRFDFPAIKFKGGVFLPEEELDALRALRKAFPDKKLRYDPNAVLSAATSIRLGKLMEPLDIEYYEDPCWGNEAMSRVRERVDIPFATNMCVMDLDQLAQGLRLGSVDIILGDIHEWGGISNTKKLQATCEVFQLGFNLHSGGELGISTAAYLHFAASVPALPHALDSHMHQQASDIVKEGVIGYTPRGTMQVPTGPGLGVELDPEKFALAAEAHRRSGDISIYAEDNASHGKPPVKSQW
jgi:glucarate dehydratase